MKERRRRGIFMGDSRKNFSSIFFRHSFIAPGQIFPSKGNVVCGT